VNLDAGSCADTSVLVKNDVVFDTASVERRLIESFVIQALGTTRRKVCDPCAEGKGIYKQCRTREGFFGGACGNCKRRERCGECNFSDVFKEALREELKDVRTALAQRDEQVTSSRGRNTTKPAVYGR
jgi:hypothetical protein